MVIGDLMVDEYLWGKVTRLSPEAPVPIVDLESESLRFGGASNVALNLKSLGCEPVIIGMIGNDRMGDSFRGLLNEHKIQDTGLLVSTDRPTTVKTRVIGDNQHLARIDREVTSYITGKDIEKAKETIQKQINGCEAVILQDYNKGFLPAELIRYSIQIATEKGLIITVDPKFINFKEYKNCTLFKPNIKEASQALARVIKSGEEIKKAGSDLLELLNTQSVLLTLGAQGMALFEKNKDMIHIPTRTRKVADVSGAGDTVISTITAALSGGADYAEAAYLANRAAGIVCEEVGIVPIEKEILMDNLKQGSE
ncbi:MAG: D-glycero-beta-D-manno-heptose-7-phosphate kinase [Calditrichaeota bacterium]|nr:MAG: D-glycero-beta-D-manno-heptose-7-phosphate kinase [Calditrichota bacterium]